MREYGKVYTAFWSNEDIRAMSEDARMLALYLMTCPHGNMLGCFRLPDAYAADDLKWSSERVSKGFGELFSNRFSYRCERSSWVFIRKYLEWNQFDNPNVGKAAGKLFGTLPAPHQLKGLIINALKEFAPTFPQNIIVEFETLSIPFANPFELSSKTVVVAVAVEGTVAEQELTPLPDAGAPSVAIERRSEIVEVIEHADQPPAALAQRVSQPRGDAGTEVREVFVYWQQARNHPQAKLDAKREKAIKARLKDGYTVGDLCRAVDGCSASAYHMGQNQNRAVYDDIELICRDASKVDGFIKQAQAQPGVDAGLQRQAQILKDWI